MKFTRSQTICFGLLGTGLIALVADRSFGGAGDAMATATTPAAVSASGELPAPPMTTPSAAPSLAARLRQLVPDGTMAGTVPDAFKPPVLPNAVDAPAVDLTAQAFKTAHVLKAVLGGGRGGRVLLNDQLIAVGESVSGFELVDVRERHAVFAGAAGRVTLELPGPSVGR